jgi:peptidoglycan-N-acetylglucosamine deacetylase
MSIASLYLAVMIPFPYIYQSIAGSYSPYILLISWVLMPPPVVRHMPIATGTTTPEKKMIYAFWVEWDDSTMLSLQKNQKSIDALVMQELTLTATGIRLLAPDKFKKTQEYLQTQTPNLPLHILINNYNPLTHIWDRDLLYTLLSNPKTRKNLSLQLYTFAIQQHIAGINIDFEELDTKTYPYYLLFLEELSKKLHTVDKTLSVDIPLSNTLYNLDEVAKRVDLVFLMAYDEHWPSSVSGPIASRDWFAWGVRRAVRDIPRDKLVITLGNYGYDWVVGTRQAVDLTVPQVHSLIRDTVASRMIDPQSGNPLFYYLDVSRRDHVVWYLDASTVASEIAILESSGINNISLWRLGSEDPGVWSIFDWFVNRTK